MKKTFLLFLFNFLIQLSYSQNEVTPKRIEGCGSYYSIIRFDSLDLVVDTTTKDYRKNNYYLYEYEIPKMYALEHIKFAVSKFINDSSKINYRVNGTETLEPLNKHFILPILKNNDLVFEFNIKEIVNFPLWWEIKHKKVALIGSLRLYDSRGSLIRVYENFSEFVFQKNYIDADNYNEESNLKIDRIIKASFRNLKDSLLTQFNNDFEIEKYIKSNAVFLAISSPHELNSNLYNTYFQNVLTSYQNIFYYDYNLWINLLSNNVSDIIKPKLSLKHLYVYDFEEAKKLIENPFQHFTKMYILNQKFSNVKDDVIAQNIRTEINKKDSIIGLVVDYKDSVAIVEKERDAKANKIIGIAVITAKAYMDAKNAASLYGSSLTNAQMNTLISSNFIGNLGNSQFYNVISGQTKVTADNLPSFLSALTTNTTVSGYGFGNQNNNGVGDLNGLNTPSPCSQEQQDEINSQIPNDPKLKAAMYKQNQNPSCMTCAYEAGIAAYEATIRISGNCLTLDRIAAYRQEISRLQKQISDLNYSGPTFNLNSVKSNLPVGYQPLPPQVPTSRPCPVGPTKCATQLN